jgi:hypothetical protein
MTLMLFLGAWGKIIHEKTYSKNSGDTVPLKIAAPYSVNVSRTLYMLAN